MINAFRSHFCGQEKQTKIGILDEICKSFAIQNRKNFVT